MPLVTRLGAGGLPHAGGAPGEKFGGFACGQWHETGKYGGTSASCVFTWQPTGALSVFKWAGRSRSSAEAKAVSNKCFMYLDADGIAMGGGEHFAFHLVGAVTAAAAAAAAVCVCVRACVRVCVCVCVCVLVWLCARVHGRRVPTKLVLTLRIGCRTVTYSTDQLDTVRRLTAQVL